MVKLLSLTYPERTETTFPEAVDNLSRMSDLSFEDLILVQQYYAYYNAGNLSGANSLLETNPILKTKIFNAAKFNKLADGIGATQQFFKDNVDGYIQTKQSEFDAYVDGKEVDLNTHVSDTVTYIDTKQSEFDAYVDGKEVDLNTHVSDTVTYIDTKQSEFNAYVNAFTYKGDYSNVTSYVEKNIVYFAGCTYVCRVACKNISPVADKTTANWGLISEKGDKGDQGVSGVGLSPRGQWDSTTTYYKDDMVIDSGSMWQCVVENINSKPSTSNTSWLKMIIDANMVIVSSAQPSNQHVGCLWMKEG